MSSQITLNDSKGILINWANTLKKYDLNDLLPVKQKYKLDHYWHAQILKY